MTPIENTCSASLREKFQGSDSLKGIAFTKNFSSCMLLPS